MQVQSQVHIKAPIHGRSTTVLFSGHRLQSGCEWVAVAAGISGAIAGAQVELPLDVGLFRDIRQRQI
jgi:hypothetical protein